MRRTKCLFTIIGIVLGLMTPGRMAFADDGDSLPPLPVLTGQWWQWAYSIPLSQNPLTDETGDRCMIGQRGSIWFLAGVGNTTGLATRTCSVPEDIPLFFPVINIVNFNSPNHCFNGPTPLTLKDLRKFVATPIDGVSNKSLKVDGQFKNNLIHRVQSEVFEVALPGSGPGPSFDNLCVDLPEGIYSPAVDDGYYVLLAPLSRGNHTIHFQAESHSSFGDFTQNITHNLTVEKVSLH
jgi:hypothetical protein